MSFISHLKTNFSRASIFKRTKFLVDKKYKHASSCLQISEGVKDALVNGKPVVALESTIITHGMPFPHNYETALAVEEIIKGQDVVPATIGIINGVIKVGLDAFQLEELSKPDKNKVKVSRRDFPFVISQKLSGGTTVSGTMVVANKVGISVFVTGGIGGVHRDGENSMDISADLTELGRTPVAVISSGVKSILDIGRTLEYLETQGVAVASFGFNKEFPAFYSRKSGYLAPYNLESTQSAAKFIQTIFNLEMNSGILIGVPIPGSFSFNEKIIEEVIVKGIEDAQAENIKGKDVTPFILNRISQITDGKSLQSNIALIKNNAFIGAQISSELEKLREQRRKEIGSDSVIRNEAREINSTVCSRLSSDKKGHAINDKIGKSVGFHSICAKTDLEGKGKAFEVTVVGGSNLDYVVSLEDAELKMDGRMLMGKINQSGGGVGRNIADALGKLGVNPFFVSAVGTDLFGKFLLDSTIPHLSSKGILTSDTSNTATCSVLCDRTGECQLLVGDMKVHDLISKNYVRIHEETIKQSSLVVFDGNLPVETIDFLLVLCSENSIPAWFEPTDIIRAQKPFINKTSPPPAFISPNYLEFLEILKILKPSNNETCAIDFQSEDFLNTCVNEAYSIAEIIHNVIITLGRNGILIVRKGDKRDSFFIPDENGNMRYKNIMKPISHRLYKPNKIITDEVVNVSGAGDCFASGFISAMLKGHDEESCVNFAFECSLASLRCATTVPNSF